MNCAEVLRFVHIDMDKELDPEDRVALERHLSSCPSCADTARGEREFLGRLRETLRVARPVAPPALAARVDRALDEVERPSAPARQMIFWGAFAAAAAVVLAIGLRSGQQEPAQAQVGGLVGEAVVQHQRELPIEVRGPDPDRIRSWFRGKLDVPVRMPAMQPRRAHLVGGRLSHLGQRQAAELQYDVGGNRISVFVFDPTDMATGNLTPHRVQGRDIYMGGARGYSVAVVNEGGLGYAFASDLDEARMLEVLSSMFSR